MAYRFEQTMVKLQELRSLTGNGGDPYILRSRIRANVSCVSIIAHMLGLVVSRNGF